MPQVRGWRRVANVASHAARRLAFCVLVADAVVERWQFDGLSAATAIPPWCWLIATLLLGVLGWSGAPRWEKRALVVAALLFAATTVEQTRSLGRLAWRTVGRSAPAPASRLRVATLNCDVASVAAAGEVRPLRPDIVLLQESPNAEALRRLANDLFGDEGSVVWSPDCAIVARGQLRQVATPHSHFVQATLALSNGGEVEVVCLRLAPPVVRYDLWSPSAWREHAGLRKKHRQQALAIAESLAAVPSDRPIVLGGDCNAPAGDGALQVWSPRLNDAFDKAGVGWGNTVLNGFPVLRFDQLWSSPGLFPTEVRSARTEHSDHRLVVGDFELR